MVNYKRKIKKGDFSFVTDLVDRRFHTSQPDWAKYAVVLHKIVAEEVDYQESGRSVPVASEMLDQLCGDCQDQTVLLSRLYLDAGLDVRVLSIEKMNEQMGHVLPQVRVPVDKNEATDILRDTYQDLFNTRPNKMAWTTKRKPYFLADPVWSSYVGDRSSLTGSYIEENGDSWDFYNVRYRKTIRSRNDPSESGSSRTRRNSGEKMGFLESLDCFADAVAEAW